MENPYSCCFLYINLLAHLIKKKKSVFLWELLEHYTMIASTTKSKETVLLQIKKSYNDTISTKF